MKLSWRYCSEADLGLLSDWNHQLIRDEGARNPMTVDQLADRMKRWLAGEYPEPVAYALFRKEKEEIYLRQLFVRRDRRSSGIGHMAMDILRREVWPGGIRLTVEVLLGNSRAVAFWRSVGYRDYSLALEIMPAKRPNKSCVTQQPSHDSG
jgi:GNAT superfamily N-acetyltransferase